MSSRRSRKCIRPSIWRRSRCRNQTRCSTCRHRCMPPTAIKSKGPSCCSNSTPPHCSISRRRWRLPRKRHGMLKRPRRRAPTSSRNQPRCLICRRRCMPPTATRPRPPLCCNSSMTPRCLISRQHWPRPRKRRGTRKRRRWRVPKKWRNRRRSWHCRPACTPPTATRPARPSFWNNSTRRRWSDYRLRWRLQRGQRSRPRRRKQPWRLPRRWRKPIDRWKSKS